MAQGEQESSVTTALNFTSNFPMPAPMKVSGDRVNSWDFFKQQWEDYELATGLDKRSQSIRLATFRSIMGKDCLEIFLNLKLTEEQRANMAQSIAALDEYFKPKTSVVYERYLFNSCVQNSEESIDGFVNRLRKAASTCKFGTLTDELIRDRIVMGVQDRTTKLRLLKEEELDLNKAMNICRSSEIASMELKSMKSEQTNNSEQINAIQEKYQNKRKNKESRRSEAGTKPKEKCYRCGKQGRHKKEECIAYGQICRICSKPNHFAVMCRQKGKPQTQQKPRERYVKAVTWENDRSDEELSEDEDPILKIEEVSNVKTPGKQLLVKLNLSSKEGQFVTETECQIDTGATCNIISYRDVARIRQEILH